MRDIRKIGAIRDIRSHFAGGGDALDPDVAIYIASASIVDQTEIDAINTAVLSMKSGTLWDASFVIYPLSPTSLAAAAVPLKGVSFTMTWFNTPVHSSAGITFGSSRYGDTGFVVADEVVSSIDWGYTVRSNMVNANAHVNGAADANITGARNVLSVWRMYANGGSPAVTAAVADTTIRIATASRRSATDLEAYIEGISAGTESASQSTLPVGLSEYLGGRNVASALTLPNAGISSWMHYHEGLSDSEALELKNIIQAYTTAAR